MPLTRRANKLDAPHNQQSKVSFNSWREKDTASPPTIIMAHSKFRPSPSKKYDRNKKRGKHLTPIHSHISSIGYLQHLNIQLLTHVSNIPLSITPSKKRKSKLHCSDKPPYLPSQVRKRFHPSPAPPPHTEWGARSRARVREARVLRNEFF